jgi:uncharacterized glyoxalase superfamily protein PhnB
MPGGAGTDQDMARVHEPNRAVREMCARSRPTTSDPGRSPCHDVPGVAHHAVGAVLAVGESSVALSETRVGQSLDWDDNTERRPPREDFTTSGVMVRVTDVDAHHDRATAFGAKTFGPPTTHRFGERQYTAEDLAGHRWSFTQSVADIAPEEWGARLPS